MASMSPEQMQQMQAIMSMAGSMPGMPPADGSGVGAPQVDPAQVQAYMQMFQYLQQAQALQGAASMGMPPMPFPGMSPYAPPYAPPAAPMEPTVAVSVEGMKFQYQLTEDDLQKVFNRYGSVKQIRVDEGGSAAQITFANFQDAQAAMNDLNGKVLTGLEGTLRISWLSGGAAAAPPAFPQVPYPGYGFPAGGALGGWPGASGAPPAPANAPGGFGASTHGGPAGGGGNPRGGKGDNHDEGGKGVRKYTCRFLIGIENDQEFQVARRVIGAKGANMKNIVKSTEAKLRLRGQGSGYFEGAGQKESSEPLQLCISCTSAEGYKVAVRQVEGLLLTVYDEYKQFHRDAGRTVPDITINLSENQLVYSGGKGPGGDMSSPGHGDYGGGSPQKDGKQRGGRSRGGGGGKGASRQAVAGETERGEPGPNAPPAEDIEKLIDDRNEARRANNFSEADRIRDMLHSQGVALMDEPGGRGRGAEVTTWRYWRD